MVAETPLWRNGPPEKPVLCNACGSRWRIRGTLEDYIPKHALAVMTSHARDRTQNPHQHKLPLERTLVSHPNIMVHNESHSDTKENAIRYDDPYSSGLGDNASHRSSSGSSSISCSDHSHTELLSSIPCSNNWNSNVPSRKRSLVQYRNLTFVEKLQKDLYDILQNEEPATLSECPDGNLIYYENGGNPEIGLGVLLLKPSIVSAQQESKTFKSEDDNS
ncbi:GATA transcription factor 26 [Vitis vinifera]|uniref:GATA transcription factor 26 n=1 Tax=Vitis vinifera TaxID=29760 RepID=A0A438HJX8_VITVI|nr:GATA transcription factor 26 [Vitis vinifera]